MQNDELIGLEDSLVITEGGEEGVQVSGFDECVSTVSSMQILDDLFKE